MTGGFQYNYDAFGCLVHIAEQGQSIDYAYNVRHQRVHKFNMTPIHPYLNADPRENKHEFKVQTTIHFLGLKEVEK